MIFLDGILLTYLLVIMDIFFDNLTRYIYLEPASLGKENKRLTGEFIR
jgi:hypothetical protein